jgi:hypothetical protein
MGKSTLFYFHPQRPQSVCTLFRLGWLATPLTCILLLTVSVHPV